MTLLTIVILCEVIVFCVEVGVMERRSIGKKYRIHSDVYVDGDRGSTS
jgi:hypothetical protein